MALVAPVDDLWLQVDKRKVSFLVLLDLPTAFHIIDREIWPKYGAGLKGTVFK